MNKENSKKLKEKNKLIKRYLWVFLVYIVAFSLSTIYMGYEQNLYPNEDTAFLLSTYIFGLIFYSFNIYNITILIKIIKRKLPKSYLFLSLSEFLPFFYVIPFTFIDVIFHIGLPRIDFLTSEVFSNSLKFLQLIFIIYLLLKIYRNKK